MKRVALIVGTFVEQMLQIIDRETIFKLNRDRKRHGEPPIIPNRQRYKNEGSENIGWIIKVPKEWTSLTGRDAS
jgi:hypothetical protein